MADDIVTRLRDVVCWCNEFDGVCDACQAANEIKRLRAELERLRVENAEQAQGWRAERALADQLANALRTVQHDRPSAHTDSVWAAINQALITHEEARRG